MFVCNDPRCHLVEDHDGDCVYDLDGGDDDALVCLNHNEDCAGPVAFHSIDPGRTRAFPRCDAHWASRLAARENSMERYADSDVPPSWFDPSYAGETW